MRVELDVIEASSRRLCVVWYLSRPLTIRRRVREWSPDELFGQHLAGSLEHGHVTYLCIHTNLQVLLNLQGQYETRYDNQTGSEIWFVPTRNRTCKLAASKCKEKSILLKNMEYVCYGIVCSLLSWAWIMKNIASLILQKLKEEDNLSDSDRWNSHFAENHNMSKNHKQIGSTLSSKKLGQYQQRSVVGTS